MSLDILNENEKELKNKLLEKFSKFLENDCEVELINSDDDNQKKIVLKKVKVSSRPIGKKINPLEYDVVYLVGDSHVVVSTKLGYPGLLGNPNIKRHSLLRLGEHEKNETQSIEKICGYFQEVSSDLNESRKKTRKKMNDLREKFIQLTASFDKKMEEAK